MSIRASAWAWQNEQVTDPLEALVLLAICDAHNDHRDECFPTIERIAKWARVSRRTAINKINSLIEQGIIEATPSYHADGRQRANSYKINMGEGARAAPPEKSAPRKGEGARAAPPERGGGAPSCTDGGAHCCTPLKVSEEISEQEGSNVPSLRKKGSRLPYDWVPSNALAMQCFEICTSNGMIGREEISPFLRREYDKFKDFWASKAGAGATKLDWDATFRNWVRKALESRPYRSRKPEEPRMSANDMVRAMFGGGEF